MKRPAVICSLSALALVVLVAHAERLGSLTGDSEVFTPNSDILAPSIAVKDGYPVFEIPVPDGWTEIQIRATTRNFEPGFLVERDGAFVLNFVPNGNSLGGYKEYQALGTGHLAKWDGGKWTFGYDNLQSTDNQVDPWNCTNFTSTSGSAYVLRKEYFVYRTCTTGAAADPTWGTGTSDADPWLYFNIQSPTESEGQYKRQQWDSGSSLTSQLQPGGTPGRSVIFQPSRGVLGSAGWMQQNHPSLVWVYSHEGVGGNDLHPDGQRIWSEMRPVEWRKARIELEPLTPVQGPPPQPPGS